MKSIIQSVSPHICANIISGECTMLLSKTTPNYGLSFKDYIYETKGLCDTPTFIDEDGHISYRGRGAVIGEFVCDRIDRLYIPISTSATPPDKEIVEKVTCLSFNELKKYANGNMFLYGLHISDLKIYDTPKELGEFRATCNKKCSPNCDCWDSEYDGCHRYDRLTRPPQSWCYVEELSE